MYVIKHRMLLCEEAVLQLIGCFKDGAGHHCTQIKHIYRTSSMLEMI